MAPLHIKSSKPTDLSNTLISGTFANDATNMILSMTPSDLAHFVTLHYVGVQTLLTEPLLPALILITATL